MFEEFSVLYFGTGSGAATLQLRDIGIPSRMCYCRRGISSCIVGGL